MEEGTETILFEGVGMADVLREVANWWENSGSDTYDCWVLSVCRDTGDDLMFKENNYIARVYVSHKAVEVE